jgi:hypothetical protein
MKILLSALLAAVVLCSCTSQQLTQVEQASQRRDAVCAVLQAYAPNTPELKEVHQLCQAGADLKDIAAAYAQCEAETAD